MNMNKTTNITLLALLVAAALAGCGKTPAGADASASASASDASAAALAPAAASAVVVASAPAAPAAATAPAAAATPAPSADELAKGEKIYTATCLACHGGGVMGAPKFGDAAAWQPRIAKGMEVLYTDAINGFKMMPPRGGNALLKDEDMKAAVDFMASKAH